ncbi:hypothetical protein, partial [Desulfovibrio cuneatus]|uniref:hypothetical protein n=1 Tax=Desulfovibrio cuneatus TaxID=159728 RepID=UPI00040A8459
MPTTIDLTPTWGEWGNVFFVLAASGDEKTIHPLRRDLAYALSAAEALKSISNTLTIDQRNQMDATLRVEMQKQGFTI